MSQRNCYRVLGDIRRWKNCHVRSLDINCEEVPPSFAQMVRAQRCELLLSVTEALFLRLRQQISFFNHCKLRSQGGAGEQWKQAVWDGKASLRQAATACGVRSCDGITVLIGKKKRRAALRRHHEELLANLAREAVGGGLSLIHI